MSTDQKITKIAPDTEGGRAIVRAAYEKAAIEIPMHRGIMEAALERLIDALKTGRIDLYIVACSDLSRASVALDDSVENLGECLSSLRHVEPGTAVLMDTRAHEVIVSRLRAPMKGVSSLELVASYVRHRMNCSDKDCHEISAYHEEMRDRRIEVPR